MRTTLYLLRHGATVANLAHPARLQGRKRDLPLTGFGIAQAQMARDLLVGQGIEHCYTSPMRCATQTASLVGEGLGLSPITVPELTECDVGSWEGMDWQSIRYFDAENYLRFMRNPAEHGYPRGETFLDVHARSSRVLEEILQRHRGNQF